MSSAEQPIRSLVEGRGRIVGLRAQCGGPTAPASWRTPNASRPRRRWADMEGCAPPRPLARVEPGPSSNRYHRAGVEPGPPKSWDGGQIRPKPSVPADGGTVSTPAGIGGRPSTASPVNDDSLSLREGIDRAPHGQCPTLAPGTNPVGRVPGSGEAIPPRTSADCRSARRLGIRAGWVSKPLGPNRQTGRVHVALSGRTTGP